MSNPIVTFELSTGKTVKAELYPDVAPKSVANFVKLLIFDKLAIPVAIVICLTLYATVIMAKLVGCTLPILAKRLKLDPAVMANPFISTIVDALSLIIYLTIATAVLGL